MGSLVGQHYRTRAFQLSDFILGVYGYTEEYLHEIKKIADRFCSGLSERMSLADTGSEYQLYLKDTTLEDMLAGRCRR